jgi:hypothetical protein
MAHEVDPENQIGCMLAAGDYYPFSCHPKDVWSALNKNRESYFFIDIQSRGTYPAYADRLFAEKGSNSLPKKMISFCWRITQSISSRSATIRLVASHMKVHQKKRKRML